MTETTYFTRLRAMAVSRISRYCSLLVQYQPVPHDGGAVLDGCEAPARAVAQNLPELGHAMAQATAGRRLVLLNGNLNYSYDIQALFESLHPLLVRRDRVLVLAYSPYWAWLHRLQQRLGLRAGEAPCTFLTRTDLAALARLSGFEMVRAQPLGVFPLRLLGLGALVDRVLTALPLVRETAAAMLLMLRPLGKKSDRKPSLSIVIPARDEKGNVEAAIRRLPPFPAPVEVVFVEGHSADGTWEEIQRVEKMEWPGITVRSIQQPGRGKADAVRAGFAECRNDLLTVLDADLTMPPELLPRFYEAWVSGKADFINGSRLVYPMEGEAMRSLNWLGNQFFAKALAFALEQPLGDSLCGTKLFSREDHRLMLAWNHDFGRFDPFGDYEMIFPAAELGLGIVDVPIRYRARTYGCTKIHRFRDGLILLRMTAVALWRMRLGVRPLNARMEDAAGREKHLKQLICGKAGLAAWYKGVYARWASALASTPAGGLVVELGSGAGFAKECVPGVLSTDFMAYAGVDQQVDALAMPWPDASVRALFLLNALHHLPDAARFLAEVARVLKPGGVLVVSDQHVGPISRLALRFAHGEPFNPEGGWQAPATDALSGANGALAWIVFQRDQERLAHEHPNLRLEAYEPFSPLLYWVSGGLKSWTLAPAFLLPVWLALDRILLRFWPGSGSFAHAVVRRA